MVQPKWMELSVEVNGTVYAVREEAPNELVFFRITAKKLVDRLEVIIREREAMDEH